MTVLWPNECIILSFYLILFVRIPNVTTFVKEVFWLYVKLRLWQKDCLWPNDCTYLFFILYLQNKFSDLDAWFTVWQNDCFVTKWMYHFVFYSFLTLIKPKFFHYMLSLKYGEMTVYATKLIHNCVFLFQFIHKNTKCNIFCLRSFFYYVPG